MDKPTGSVTFLFTDIEGSTKLSQEFPETLPDAIEIHNSILKNAIEKNNGFVFEIIGDAFCSAFQNADDAVNAAIEMQLNLSKENWSDAVIKIRIGIHSGNAEWNGRNYMGYITLARSARVMSAAYGEQILISEDAYQKCVHKLSHEITNEKKKISFRDLGERRLKDVIQPLRLYQISAAGLREEFPPLNTLDARPNNLPVQLSSFIGRQNELKQIKNLLKQTSLLTLTGPGGTGKTRLALQTAADVIDEFANGVWFVQLDSLQDAEFLPNTILKAINILEQPDRNVFETLISELKEKELLLILDNCEHIVEECSKLAEQLLQKSPKLKIFATSREALHCSGEKIFAAASMHTPDPKEEIDPEHLMQYESVRLFIERALEVNSNFRVTNENAPALAQICHQLDGIPLAIELAAARIKILTVEKIYDRLNDRFKLLTGGKRTALPRQQTLKAMIEWSYELLSENEKCFWRRLSVFAGGCALEDAEEICSDEILDKDEMLDLIHNLVGKSIIIFNETHNRFRMLETIKQYGKEKLNESDESEIIFNRHLDYFKSLGERAATEFVGTKAKGWLDKFELEHSNIQAALLWAFDKQKFEDGSRLTCALGKFWEIRGYTSECKTWLEKFMSEKESITDETLGRSYKLAGIISSIQGRYPAAEEFLNSALEIFERLADVQGVSSVLNVLGLNQLDQGDYENSRKNLLKSLSLIDKSEKRIAISNLNNSIGLVYLSEGNYEEAKKYFTVSLNIARELEDNFYIGVGLNNLGNVEASLENFPEAAKIFEESLLMEKKLGNQNGIVVSLANLGSISMENKDFSKAEILYLESNKISRDIGFRFGIINSLSSLGMLEVFRNRYDKAELFFKECLQLQIESPDFTTLNMCMIGLATIKLKSKPEYSVKILGSVEIRYKSAGATMEISYSRFFENTLASAKKILGEERVAKELNNGSKIPIETFVKEILDEPNVSDYKNC